MIGDGRVLLDSNLFNLNMEYSPEQIAAAEAAGIPVEQYVAEQNAAALAPEAPAEEAAAPAEEVSAE